MSCSLYLVNHKCFTVSHSGESITLDTTDAGSFRPDNLEILMLSGSLVSPIRFDYLPLIIISHWRASLFILTLKGEVRLQVYEYVTL